MINFHKLEDMRKNAEEASELPFTAWTVSQAVEKDIPALLAEVERLTKENAEYERALSQIAHGDTYTAYPHDIAAWALGLEIEEVNGNET